MISDYYSQLVAKQLRECRQLRAMGVRAACKAAGINVSTLSDTEVSKFQLAISRMFILLAVYEVSVQDFFAHFPAHGSEQQSDEAEVVGWLDRSIKKLGPKTNRAIYLIQHDREKLDSFQRAKWLTSTPSGKTMQVGAYIDAQLRDHEAAMRKEKQLEREKHLWNED